MTSSFNWDEFDKAEIENVKSENNNQSNTQPEEGQKEEKKFDFSNFQEEKPPEKEEGGFEKLNRTHIRNTSRVAERILGAPQDLKNFVFDLATGAGELVTRSKNPKFEKFLSELQDSGLFGLKTPSSSELKKKSSELTKGYTEPKNKTEELGDEFIESATDLATGGIRGRNPLFRHIGVPLAGILAKEGTALFTDDPKKQQYVKIGAMIATDLLTQGNARRHGNELLAQAENRLPQNAHLNVQSFNNSQRIHDLETSLQRGSPSSPDKTDARRILEEIRQANANGTLTPRSALQFNRDINQALEKVGGFNVGPLERAAATRNLNNLKGGLRDSIADYGRRHDPEFLRLYENGNQALTAFHQSNSIANFIKKHFGNKIQSTTAKVLFGSSLAGGAALPKAAVISAPAAAIYQGYKILRRINQSPELRRYYTNVLTDSLRQNVVGTANNLKKLDNAFLKEEKKEKN